MENKEGEAITDISNFVDMEVICRHGYLLPMITLVEVQDTKFSL